MKKTTRSQLTLATLTVQTLSGVSGGTAFPRPTAKPSVCDVSCLPPRSAGCYTDGCPTETL